MLRFDPRWVIGKTIADVQMRPFPDGRGRTAHDPRIVFTDGSRITFHVQETDVEPVCGIGIYYWKG